MIVLKIETCIKKNQYLHYLNKSYSQAVLHFLGKVNLLFQLLRLPQHYPRKTNTCRCPSTTATVTSTGQTTPSSGSDLVKYISIFTNIFPIEDCSTGEEDEALVHCRHPIFDQIITSDIQNQTQWQRVSWSFQGKHAKQPPSFVLQISHLMNSSINSRPSVYSTITFRNEKS